MLSVWDLSGVSSLLCRRHCVCCIVDTQEGHDALLRYIKDHGFTRFDPAAKPVPVPMRKEASSRPVATKRTSSDGAAKFSHGKVTHCGRTYHEGSAGYAILELLFPTTGRVLIGTIIAILKADLEWGTRFDRDLDRENNALCASWTLTIPGVFEEENEVFELKKPELLMKNYDYFVDDVPGREALESHLKTYGFEAPHDRVSFPSAVKAANLPPSASKSPAADSPRASAAQQGKKRKADTDVDEGRPQFAVIAARGATIKSAAQDASCKGANAHAREIKGAADDVSSAGSDAVSASFGHLTLRRRSPSKACYRAADPSTQLDRLVPDQQGSPLFSFTAEDEDEGSDFEEEAQEETMQTDDPHLQDVLDMLVGGSEEEADEGDTGFLPLTQGAPADLQQSRRTRTGRSRSGAQKAQRSPRSRSPRATPPSTQSSQSTYISQDDPDEDGYGPSLSQLLSRENPNFLQVFQILCDQFEWHYQYITDITKLPNGEKAMGRDKIYFRKGRTFQTPHLGYNVDYFLNEECVLQYVRSEILQQTLPSTEMSPSSRPRSTRSGKVLDLGAQGTTVTTGVTVNEAGSPILAARRGAPRKSTAHSPPSSAGSDGDAHKRARTCSFDEDLSAAAPQTKKGKVVAPTVRERAEAALRDLNLAAYQSAYSGGACAAEVPTERAEEHLLLLKYVQQALGEGQGGVIYLQGLAGMGKTTTAVNVLDHVAQQRMAVLKASGYRAAGSSSSVPPLGYNVVWLNGSGLGLGDLKQIALEVIPSYSGPELTAARAEEKVRERFACVAAPVVLEGVDEKYRHSAAQSGYKASGGGKNRPVPMTVLVIDEMDSMHRPLLHKLLAWGNRETSSLLLLGIGNTASSRADLFKNAVMNTIDFAAYDEAKLKSIVHRLSHEVFQEAALQFLAKRVCNAYKCKGHRRQRCRQRTS
jgi:Cdc6-like AAA superfamily ATPase